MLNNMFISLLDNRSYFTTSELFILWSDDANTLCSAEPDKLKIKLLFLKP